MQYVTMIIMAIIIIPNNTWFVFFHAYKIKLTEFTIYSMRVTVWFLTLWLYGFISIKLNRYGLFFFHDIKVFGTWPVILQVCLRELIEIRIRLSLYLMQLKMIKPLLLLRRGKLYLNVYEAPRKDERVHFGDSLPS